MLAVGAISEELFIRLYKLTVRTDLQHVQSSQRLMLILHFSATAVMDSLLCPRELFGQVTCSCPIA